MADLGRSCTRPDQLAGRRSQRQPVSQLACKEISLVEPALPQPRRVKWYGQDPVGGEPLYDQALGEQERQGPSQTPPPLVLEALHSELDRALVGDG
jgi:hypothetical protein